MLSRLFTTAGHQKLQRVGPWFLWVTWVVLRAWGLETRFVETDVVHFQEMAQAIRNGGVPYVDVTLEYPPGAVLVLMLASGLSGLLGMSFSVAFQLLACTAEALAGVAAWRLLSHVPAGERVLRAAAALVSLTALQTMVFNRMDIMATAALLWALALHVRGRAPAAVGALLALGASIKVFPVLVVPLFLVGVPLRSRATASMAAGALAGGLAASIPAWRGLLAMVGTVFGYHAERPLQLESTWATLLMLLDKVVPLGLSVAFHHHAFHLDGPASVALGNVAPPAVLAAVVATLILGMRELGATTSPSPGGVPSARGEALVRGVALVLAASILAHKTLSPQYLVWLVPLVAASRGGNLHRESQRMGLLLFAALLSPVVYPVLYQGLKARHAVPLVVLALRNGALVALGWNLLRGARPAARIPLPGTASWRLSAGVSVVVGTVALMALRPHANADLLLHLRMGEDILRDVAVPRVDTYGALTAGEPFVAHEWLSSVILNRLDHLGGGTALGVMLAELAVAITLLAWGSLGPAERRSALALPVFAAGGYVLASRIIARPHAFALLLEAWLVFAVEKWRRNPGSRVLWTLVPVQVAWANLHGSYLLAPVLMGAVAVGTALAAGDASTARRAARHPAAVAVALLAAGLVNPYGPRLYAFSAGMMVGKEYISQSILEWRPLTDPIFHAEFWVPVVAVLCVLAILGLAARRPREHAVDVLMILAALALLARAARFTPEFILLVTGPLLRGATLFTRALLAPRHQRPAVLVPTACTAVFAALCVATGIPVAPGVHITLGTTYASPTFDEEVDLLRSGALGGRVFNEFEDGSALVLAMPGELRPVVDMRVDLLGAARWRDYQAALASPDAFLAYLDRHAVDLVLLQPQRTQHLARLAASGAWETLRATDQRVLLVRGTRVAPPSTPGSAGNSVGPSPTPDHAPP